MASYVEFMGYTQPWYSVRGVEAPVGGSMGYLTCFLRDGDRVFLTYSTTGRGNERVNGSLGLLDMTPYGRGEAWEDKPEGWARGTPPWACWSWRTDAEGTHTWGPTSRPVPQWTRHGATPVETLGRHGHHPGRGLLAATQILLRRGGDAGWFAGAAGRFENEEPNPQRDERLQQIQQQRFGQRRWEALARWSAGGRVDHELLTGSRVDAVVFVPGEHVVDPADHQDLRRRDVLRPREAGEQLLRELDERVPAPHRIDADPPANITPINRSGCAWTSASLAAPNWFQKYYGAANW